MLRQAGKISKAAFTKLPSLKLSSQKITQRVNWEDSFLLHEAHPLERDHLFDEVTPAFLC